MRIMTAFAAITFCKDSEASGSTEMQLVPHKHIDSKQHAYVCDCHMAVTDIHESLAPR